MKLLRLYYNCFPLSATDVVKEIKDGMHQVEEVYQQCNELSDVIGSLREVNRRFQQVSMMS